MATQQERLTPYFGEFMKATGREMPTLWRVWERNETEKKIRLSELIDTTEQQYIEKPKGNCPASLRSTVPFPTRSLWQNMR